MAFSTRADEPMNTLAFLIARSSGFHMILPLSMHACFSAFLPSTPPICSDWQRYVSAASTDKT